MTRDLSKYEQDYLQQPYERFQVRFRKRKIREILDRHAHGRIIEIGCGLEPLFQDFLGFDHLTVLEPAGAFYQRAQELLAAQPKDVRERVHLVNATLEAAAGELVSKDYDIALVSSLLHEVSAPEKFLRRVVQTAGSGALIHVNVPNARSFHRLLAFESGLIATPEQFSAANVQFQQHTVFDLPGLQALALRCGCEVVESGSYSFKPFTHRQMEDMLQAGILSEKVIEGLYTMEKYAPGCGSEIYVNLRRRQA